jgi:hypothetical protein
MVGRSLFTLAARFITMIYKLPCWTQRRLNAGLDLRLGVTAGSVILGACDEEEATLYTHRPFTSVDISAILDRCRRIDEETLPTDSDEYSPLPCSHPADEQIDDDGHVVSTACDLCTGCDYERPLYVLPNNGTTLQRKHFFTNRRLTSKHI